MKATIFFLIVTFSFFLLSFHSYPNEEDASEKKSPDTLYATGLSYNDGIKKLLFHGDDILYFNTTTREIEFNDSVYKNFANCDRMSIYLNNDPLFENFEITSTIMSNCINDLVLVGDFLVFNSAIRISKYFLWDGYPQIVESWPEATKEKMRSERETSAEKRKKEWDIFTQYLKDTGKLVGNPTAIEQGTTTDLASISIYPNPTTGELNIMNHELLIRDIQVFDVMGKKYPLRIERAVGEVDISHLPAGIYFMQITTEKGVVAKKVVKR